MITAIVLSNEATNYRKLAQRHYNLTDEQMKGVDVHHNPPRSEGGRNIPEHLYVYSPENHSLIHEDDFITYARKGYEAGIGNPSNRLPKEQRSELARNLIPEGKGLGAISKEERIKINKSAGQVSGNLHKERGTGVCGISPEEHSARISETNKKRWMCPECGYTNIARHVNKHMQEEHNLQKSVKLKVVG